MAVFAESGRKVILPVSKIGKIGDRIVYLGVTNGIAIIPEIVPVS